MIDVNAIANQISSLQDDLDNIIPIATQMINEYSSDLDNTMQKVYNEVLIADNPSIEIIQKLTLQISLSLYNLCEALNKSNLLASLSSARLKENYNNSYISLKQDNAKATMNDLQSKSENITQYERIINNLYDSCSKILKYKVDCAQTLINTLNKILTIQTQQMNQQTATVSNRLLEG